MKIPKSRPRYATLVRRERLVQGWRDGIVVPEGLIAHGRGEAFDYLLGEETPAPALVSEKTAAALLLTADHPVISVNGNVAALAPKETVRLARAGSARPEVNLFPRTEARVARSPHGRLCAGARVVLGAGPLEMAPLVVAASLAVLVVGVGTVALTFIVEHGGAGYFPARMVRRHIEEHRLFPIAGAPRTTMSVIDLALSGRWSRYKCSNLPGRMRWSMSFNRPFSHSTARILS